MASSPGQVIAIGLCSAAVGHRGARARRSVESGAAVPRRTLWPGCVVRSCAPALDHGASPSALGGAAQFLRRKLGAFAPPPVGSRRSARSRKQKG